MKVDMVDDLVSVLHGTTTKVKKLAVVPNF